MKLKSTKLLTSQIIKELNSRLEEIGNVKLLLTIFGEGFDGQLDTNPLRGLPPDIARCSSCRRFFLHPYPPKSKRGRRGPHTYCLDHDPDYLKLVGGTT